MLEMMISAKRIVSFLLLLFGLVVESFVVHSTRTSHDLLGLFVTTKDDYPAFANEDANPIVPNNDGFSSPVFDDLSVIGRRTLFQQSSSSVSAIITLSSFLLCDEQDTALAAEAAQDTTTNSDDLAAPIKPGSSPYHPVVVLGGGGKTGKLCTEIMAGEGMFVRCVTRTGRKVLEDGSSGSTVSYAAADVTKYDQVQAAVKGASGVIFAASASGRKQGGDPAHVDYLGVYQTAKACIAQQVPKLVLISAGTTTRPDSIGFKATNAFVQFIYGEKIMDYKIAGEAVVRDLYASANNPALSYSVIRPGKKGVRIFPLSG
jgi:hypothetical protein